MIDRKLAQWQELYERKFHLLAREELRELLAVEPKSAVAWFFLAQTELALRNAAGALAAARKGADLIQSQGWDRKDPRQEGLGRGTARLLELLEGNPLLPPPGKAWTWLSDPGQIGAGVSAAPTGAEAPASAPAMTAPPKSLAWSPAPPFKATTQAPTAPAPRVAAAPVATAPKPPTGKSPDQPWSSAPRGQVPVTGATPRPVASPSSLPPPPPVSVSMPLPAPPQQPSWSSTLVPGGDDLPGADIVREKLDELEARARKLTSSDGARKLLGTLRQLKGLAPANGQLAARMEDLERVLERATRSGQGPRDQPAGSPAGEPPPRRRRLPSPEDIERAHGTAGKMDPQAMGRGCMLVIAAPILIPLALGTHSVLPGIIGLVISLATQEKLAKGSPERAVTSIAVAISVVALLCGMVGGGR